MTTHNSRSYNNIFITGMPAAGKSTFGRIYAYYTQREFIDFDNFIEETTGLKISKIFSKYGLQGFRARETEILPLLLQKKNKIISLGGGTLLKQKNYQLVQKNGLIVSLIGLPLPELAERILKDMTSSNKRKRPLFSSCQNSKQVLEKISDLHSERNSIYEKSDILLNQDYNSTDNMVLKLLKIEKIYK